MDEYNSEETKQPLQVCECNAAFRSSSELHTLLYHQIKNIVFKCPICQHESITETGLQHHFKFVHNLVILNPELWETHVTPAFLKLLTCPYCYFQTSTQLALQHHIATKHANCAIRRRKAFLNMNMEMSAQDSTDIAEDQPQSTQVVSESPIVETPTSTEVPPLSSAAVTPRNFHLNPTELQQLRETTLRTIREVTASQLAATRTLERFTEMATRHPNYGTPDTETTSSKSEEEHPPTPWSTPSASPIAMYNPPLMGVHPLPTYSGVDRHPSFTMPDRIPPRILCGNLISYSEKQPRMLYRVKLGHPLPNGEYIVRRDMCIQTYAIATVHRGFTLADLPLISRVEFHLYTRTKVYELDMEFTQELTPGRYKIIKDGPQSYINSDLIVDETWALRPNERYTLRNP